MKLPYLQVLAALTLLPGITPLVAAEAPAGFYLAFACDGSIQERRFLAQDSGTWVINQNRAVSPELGQAVYRVPFGKATLKGLRVEVNQVPFRVEVSPDGSQWETLFTNSPTAPEPMQFATQDLSFTDGQRKAAEAAGCVWLRFKSEDKATTNLAQLKYLRLDVGGQQQPPGFVRDSRLREHARLVVGVLMILAGVVPMWLSWRRLDACWRVWAAGAALWVISVALKFGFSALTSMRVNAWLYGALSPGWANLAIQFHTGLLTGIFECGIFLVVARAITRRAWRWGEALAMGLAFGVVEAVVTGALVTASAGQPGTWDCLADWSDMPVAAFERLLTLPIHAAAVVMILRALLERRWGWFAASFLYKTAVDGLAAWLTLSGLERFSSYWVMEWVCFGPFALLGLLVLLYLRRRWTVPVAGPPQETAAAAG